MAIKMKLLTHIAKTNNKIARNKFLKINNQAIYNGSVNRFSRAIVMNNLHEYILSNIPQHIIDSASSISFPIEIIFKIKTVINHGDIRMTSKGVSWKKPSKDYVPRWDIDNLAFIWIKAFNDTLVENKILFSDSVNIIQKTSYEFTEVKDLNDLELEVIIKKI